MLHVCFEVLQKVLLLLTTIQVTLSDAEVTIGKSLTQGCHQLTYSLVTDHERPVEQK